MNAAMFTDLYELTMAQAYLREDMQQQAVFELFFRKLPDCRNFVVAAGLESVLEMLEALHFTPEDVDYLREYGQFGTDFLDYLKDFRFNGDVYALAEGTVVFPHEPLIQVVAPLPMAQIIETLVLNQVHRQFTAGQMTKDLVALHDEPSDEEPLLQPVMERGRRLPAGQRSLEHNREHARDQLHKLPPALRSLASADSPYSVEISEGVQESLDRFRRSQAAGE